MFNLFNKKSETNIEKSVNKYNQILSEDINLVICTRYNGKSYTSYVEYLNNREVVFRCPIDKNDIVRFNNKSIIKVEFVSYSGLYTTELLITEKIIENDILYYKGEISAPIEKNERRKHYRLPIFLDLSYKVIPMEKIKYSGNTLDISVDGMLMETNEDIFQDKKLKIEIDIDGKVYNIESTIIKKRNNYRNNTYIYNLKFDNLKNRYKNEISRFIFSNIHLNAKKAINSK